MDAIIALLAAMLLAVPAAAQPARCSGGRFVVDGDPLDLGAPADRITAVEVGTADPPTVRVDAPCGSVDGVRILHPRATIVRAALEGCGDAPTTTVRIRLPIGCDGATVRVRRAGVLFAQRALRLDAGTPVPPGPPHLTGISPDHGAPGDVVTVSGTNLDRDGSGDIWQGSPPWHVLFNGPGALPGFPADATFTVVSPTELRVTVPDVPIGVPGSAGFALTSSILIFEQGGIVSSTDPFFMTPPPAAPQHLRIENDSQYGIVSLRRDGTDLVSDPLAVIPIGGALDLAPPGSARLEIGYGVAFGEPLITESVSVGSVLPGANPVPLGPITIAQLLTDFESNGAVSHAWVSNPVRGADGLDHVQTLAVSRDGSWALFVDGAARPDRTGALTLVSWPDDALDVEFALAPDLPTITIATPFTSFTMNGRTFTAH